MPAKVARAGGWGLAGRTVLLLANLGATPFTIRLLGPPAYGLWALIQAVFTWASLAQGGMWAATTKYGAERYAAGDAIGEAQVVWTGLCVVLTTTSAVGLGLALGAHLLLMSLHVRGSLLVAGSGALWVGCAGLVVSSLIGTVNTVQQVRLRWKEYTIITVASNCLGAIGVPLAIFLFSGGIVTAAGVGLVASSLYLLGLSWDAARLQSAILRPQFDIRTLRKLVSYGGAVMVAGIAGVPLLTGERFFLQANASSTAVAYYAVAITVATSLQVLPEQLGTPLMPALTRLEAEGKHEEHRRLFAKVLAGLFLVMTPAAIVAALLARPFLSTWAGPAYGSHSTTLLLIALVGVWANGFAWIPSAYLLSANKTRLLASLQMAELAPYLAAAWFLTAKWGALGAAVVWSGRLALDSVALFVIVKRSSQLPVVPLSERRVRTLVAPALLGLASLGAARLSGGLLARSAMAMILLVPYGAITWALVLTAKERRGVRNLLNEVVGPRFKRRRPAHARRR